MARFTTYMTQSNDERIGHVRDGILIGIVLRINRTGNDLRGVHKDAVSVRYVCACVNKGNCVVGMGDIIHRTVNVNVGRQSSPVHTLNGAHVMNMPNSGVIGVGGHNTLAFGQTKKTHESEGGHVLECGGRE